MINSEFANSLKIQTRVVHALFMREILTRFGRHNIGFLWMFAEPMIFTIAITILWNAINATHGLDVPISAFALTGYSSVLLWRTTVSHVSGAISSNMALLYHHNVRVIDLFIARIILEISGITISFIVLSGFFIWMGLIEPPADILTVIGAWFLLAWFGAALSIFMGILKEEYDFIDRIWSPVSYILFPLSGAAFMVDLLPVRAQEVILYLPMVHGVELLRKGYFGEIIPYHYDITYIVLFNLSLSFIALVLLKKISNRIELQ